MLALPKGRPVAKLIRNGSPLRRTEAGDATEVRDMQVLDKAFVENSSNVISKKQYFLKNFLRIVFCKFLFFYFKVLKTSFLLKKTLKYYKNEIV